MSENQNRSVVSDYQNRSVVLARRPVGEVRDEDFRIETEVIRELRPGEFLIEVLYLSLDPYMRPKMNDVESYMPPMELDKVVQGENLGRVVQSRSEKFAVGDYVTSYTGWQQYAIASDETPMLYKVDPAGLPLSAFLGPAGMPGRTGYLGLTRVGNPKAGETVVVSAASGAVGSVVGQVAKMIGCRAVGIAGGEAKCRYAVDELGLDACVDYKAGELAADLAAACPGRHRRLFRERRRRGLARGRALVERGRAGADLRLHLTVQRDGHRERGVSLRGVRRAADAPRAPLLSRLRVE